MTKRAAMFPTSLLSDKAFIKLSQPEQLLLMKLWLSSHLDSAGFHPLQISKWARGSTPPMTEAQMRDVVGGLEAQHWIAVDYDTEEVFLRPFIRMDAQKQPQIYVAACRAVQAAQSPELQRAAWEQVLIVHPPKIKHDAKDPERQERQQTTAYEDLRDFMESQGEGFRQASARLPVGSGVDVDVGVGVPGEEGGGGRSACVRCRRNPEARDPGHPGLCGACIGREQSKPGVT
jgi:hypothetical protein